MLKRNIATITEILETYDGRDKVLKCLSYAAKFATFFAESPTTSTKFIRFGSKMSECRVILRLMDDIPILHEAIGFRCGKQEPDGCTRMLDLLKIALDAIASPVEHICWAAEQKLVKADSSFWDNLSTRLWVVCLCVSILISQRRLFVIHSAIEAGSSCDKPLTTEENKRKEELMRKRRVQLLTCLRLMLDLSYAISYLPSVKLWGSPLLKTWQVGLLGTLSSIIGIHQLFLKTASR